MARWTGYPSVAFVLEAGDAWRDRCFIGNGSIFTDRALWTPENLHDLLTRYVETPVSSGGDFFDKLKQQLAGAPPPVIQVAAEVLWFLHLFPGTGVLKSSTKREHIETVWSWSGEDGPTSPFLDDEHLQGVGHPGTAYLTYRPMEFDYVLRMTVAFKDLPVDERTRLMRDDVPWGFMKWLDQQPGSDRRLARGALLYFLFPDYLERNLSREHKRLIYTAFKDKLPASEIIKSRNPGVGEYDRAIASIRAVLEQERGTRDIDFYDDDTKGLWFSQLRDNSVKEFTSWVNTFLSDKGLQINQPGRDLKRLDEKRSVDPATGFWRNPQKIVSKPPRWLMHFDLADPELRASVPPNHRSAVIGYANTSGSNSGSLLVRILPVMKLAEGDYRDVERWEWLLLFCFPSGLKPGSAAETFERFDVETGGLTYMKAPQEYVFASLLCLNAPEEKVAFPVNGQTRSVSYQEATDALQALIQVEFPEVAHE